MQNIKTLGIIGGTFDPVHYGHLTAAECARCAFNLDKVIFMLSAQPPHKKRQDISGSEERLTMLKQAVADNPAFEISTLELERKGYSYTVDTIQYYLDTYPEVNIYFILGADALLLINTWKEVTRLVRLCQFIAVARPGYRLDRSDIAFKNVPEMLWTIKYLVPPPVEQYIYKKGLYRAKELNS